MHPPKALRLILLTDDEIVREVRPVQLAKEPSPMRVSPGGITRDVKRLQFTKAQSPIETSDHGSFSEVNFEEFAKALFPIDVTEFWSKLRQVNSVAEMNA